MAELVIFADAEQFLIDVLTPMLAANGFPVPVGTSVPDHRPAEFVTLFRTGGPQSTMVTDAAQITVDCRAALESRAQAMAQMVRAIINALPQVSDAVTSVQEFSGPGNLPDPAMTGGARYRQTFAVNIFFTATIGV